MPRQVIPVNVQVVEVSLSNPVTNRRSASPNQGQCVKISTGTPLRLISVTTSPVSVLHLQDGQHSSWNERRIWILICIPSKV